MPRSVPMIEINFVFMINFAIIVYMWQKRRVACKSSHLIYASNDKGQSSISCVWPMKTSYTKNHSHRNASNLRIGNDHLLNGFRVQMTKHSFRQKVFSWHSLLRRQIIMINLEPFMKVVVRICFCVLFLVPANRYNRRAGPKSPMKLKPTQPSYGCP